YAMHFTFHSNKNVSETAKIICAAYGENVVT
ncbi:hypothetical protein EAI_01788, partial [Harpegnathos saltator]